MKGNCYIDDINIHTRFGVWITRGGYNDLLIFPVLKDPQFNDWREEDGIEVDLENPVIAAKEISITFFHSYKEIDVYDFIAFISQPGYHTFYIPSLKRSWKLRLLTQPSNQRFKDATSFTLKFVEDVPVRGSGSAPDPGLPVKNSSYELDGAFLSNYGIIVQSGAESVLKSPTVKEGLNRDIQTLDGKIYDTGSLSFDSKDVTLKCLFKTVSIDHFWRCYDAFLGLLVSPGEKLLYVDYTGDEYPCFYKRSSGFKVITLGSPLLVEFNLTLTFTVFRIEEMDYILASESGERIVLEEDGETLIDMKYYAN